MVCIRQSVIEALKPLRGVACPNESHTCNRVDERSIAALVSRHLRAKPRELNFQIGISSHNCRPEIDQRADEVIHLDATTAEHRDQCHGARLSP